MEQNTIQYHNAYIQNRDHWCWAVCCKLVGEKYKSLHPEYRHTIIASGKTQWGEVKEQEYQTGVITTNHSGIRWALQEHEDGLIRVDAWQRAIVMNANTTHYQGYEGDCHGDDEAKERGLNYCLTGDIKTKNITIETLGSYQAKQSLLSTSADQLEETLQNKEYLIGNAVIQETKSCHSVVLLSHTAHRILLYDPDDGRYINCHETEALLTGYQSKLGTAVIKWLQRIVR